MTTTLAVLIGAVAVYCAGRVVIPSWRDEHHGVDMDLAHVVMGAAMVAMFLTAIPAWANGPSLAVFAGGIVWFGIRGLRHAPRGPRMRLGVACLAMFYMLAPTAATADTGHHAAHGHQAPAGGIALGGLLLIAVLAGVAVAAAVGLCRSNRSIPVRLSSSCELAMAIAMGFMLAAPA